MRYITKYHINYNVCRCILYLQRIVKFRRIAKSVLIVSGIWIWLKRYMCFLAAIPPNYRLISIRKVKQDIFVIIQVYPNTQHEGLVFYGDVHSRAR